MEFSTSPMVLRSVKSFGFFSAIFAWSESEPHAYYLWLVRLVHYGVLVGVYNESYAYVQCCTPLNQSTETTGWKRKKSRTFPSNCSSNYRFLSLLWWKNCSSNCSCPLNRTWHILAPFTGSPLSMFLKHLIWATKKRNTSYTFHEILVV